MENNKELKLNLEQKKAITHKKGPLLIIAGAGTGKTMVVTQRIAYIINQKWANPSEILALTFTEKAAAEIEERVDVLVPYGFTDSWISTFHSFGDKILRDYSFSLGLPVDFKVLTTLEQIIFLKQNIYEFDLKYFRPVSNPLSHIQELIKHFSRLKDELIHPENYLKYAKKTLQNIKDQNQAEKIEAEKTLELAKAYKKYQELMIANGNLDFGDQIYLVYKLLRTDPSVLKKIRNQFKYILVDEFQDTNFAQNELIKLIAGKKGNITVVGDDDQSIYRFRGAAISNILDFKKYYKDTKQVVLNKNYRSSQEILDYSYNLIQNNNPDRLEIQNKIDKHLIANFHNQIPELIYANNLSGEADSVVKKIVQLKKEKKYKFKDFAILIRANNHANFFINSLNSKGIPFMFSGSANFYSLPEIKMLVAFLKCLVYSDDSISFYQLATSEIYNISDKVLTKIFAESKKTNRSFWQILKKKKNKALFEFVNDIENYRKRKKEPVGEMLYDYLDEKKYFKNLVLNASYEEEQKIKNITKFFEKIESFNSAQINNDTFSFLENLELIISAGDEIVSSEIDTEIDAVNILTVHSAKGLEWPVVFIVNCVADRFPSRNKGEQLPVPKELIKERLPQGNWHLQEERRLFYVAATRAKYFLFFSAAEDYGGKRAKKISPFVLEFLNTPKIETKKQRFSAIEKIRHFQKKPIQKIKLPEKFNQKIIRLSRQQIDDYNTCPRKFYYGHILKIPFLKNSQIVYGTAIHNALNKYFQVKINKQKMGLQELLKNYEQAFENIGFISREHEKRLFEKGQETLKNFYKHDKDEKQIPEQVEQPFEFLENNLKIIGRYDLIYGKGKNVEIRDFKTSDVNDQKKADQKIKESTQMMIYALSWYKKYEIIPKTSLFFIESNLIAEKVFAKKELEKTQKMIDSVEKGIRKNNMKATPDLIKCNWCPYKDICSKAFKN